MKNYFSLIQVESKLKLFKQLTAAAGVVLKSGEKIYTYPQNLSARTEEILESE